jgi:hypothetical protein
MHLGDIVGERIVCFRSGKEQDNSANYWDNFETEHRAVIRLKRYSACSGPLR